MLDAVGIAAVAVLCFLVAFVYANLGLGGGLLFVPILLSFGVGGGETANLVAVPISLALTIATASAAILTHRRKGLVDAASARVLIPGAFLGTLAGTAVNVFLLSRPTFLLFFTAVLLAFGVLMLREKLRGGDEDRDHDGRYTPRRKAAASAASVGSGFFSGAAGVGGGLINVPILTVILGRRARKAVGTSSLVIVPVALLGFVLTLGLNTWKGGATLPEDFALIPLLLPLVFLGAYLGSTIGLRRVRTRTVTLVFIALIFVTAGKLIAVDLLRLA